MYACGAKVYGVGFAAGLQPDPVLWIDEWADAYQRIPADTGAAEPGKYLTERTPYARAVMRALSPEHPCKRVVVMGASQMLKTQTFLNWMGGCIHMAPANILAMMPSLPLAKRLSSRVAKTIEAVPVLRERVARPRSRDARNTLDTKDFTGGQLIITTAGSAANLAEIAARYLYGDEIDRWERNVGDEGDPVEIFEARASTFAHNAKFYYTSSPTVEGASKIKDLHDQGTQCVPYVPCPHCGHSQVLHFEQLKWNASHTAVHFICADCGAAIEEHHKATMLPAIEFRATAEGDGETESFWISALYMPLGWLSWLSIMRQYDKALVALKNGNPEPMQVFYNTRLAKVWDHAQERTRGAELKARAEDYALRTIPTGVLVLTAAVDTQVNRLELLIKGWGIGLESWTIDHQVIMGDPAEASTWDMLDERLQAEFVHPSGQRMKIAAVGVDSGGAHTQDVYQFCRQRRWRHVLAIKGESKRGRPVLAQRPSKVDVSWRGHTEKNGCELWMIGTDTAKDWIYNRFKLPSGPGAQHFSVDLPDEYYDQLTAERKLVRYVKGRPVTEWVKPRSERNEVLDLTVYNLAMAHYLQLHRYQVADWEKLQMKYAQTGLFDSPAVAAAAPPAAVTDTTPAKPAGVSVSKPAGRRVSRSGYLGRR